MSEQVIEIYTGVFRMLKKRDPWYMDWSDEKPGPTQRILVADDIYNELIDRAIAKRKTLDQVIAEICVRPDSGGNPKVPHLPQRIPRYC